MAKRDILTAITAFGRAFDPFDFHKDHAAYQPICANLAEYGGANLRFTRQEKVCGIETRGIRPTNLHALCTQHGTVLKITTQLLMAQHGIRAGAGDEAGSSLIADLAPRPAGFINAQDEARHLGVSVYLLRSLTANGCRCPEMLEALLNH